MRTWTISHDDTHHAVHHPAKDASDHAAAVSSKMQGVSTVPVSNFISRCFCVICGRYVKLDSFQVDSQGQTVHEECLAAKTETKQPPSPA